LGAGAIGKAVAGYIFTQMGCRVVFSDIVPSVVEDINARTNYRIYETETEFTEVWPQGAFLSDDEKRMNEEISRADYIATSVGPNGFESTIERIGRFLARDGKSTKPVVLFFFENMKNSGVLAKECLSRFTITRPLSFLPLSIERMSSGYAHDSMFDVISEPFIPVYAPKADLRKEDLEFLWNYPRLIQIVENFDAYYYRKLYTNNMGHAVLAYIGSSYSCKTVVEAIEVREVRETLPEALAEAGEMLIREYGFGKTEIDSCAKLLVEKRYTNHSLNDPLERLARDPIRKLGRNERLTGTALLCLKHGIDPSAIVKTMVYAMKYENPADASSLELAKILKEKGEEYILSEICGLKKEEKLYNLFIKQREKNF
jgi:mannitol-1-phosphate 5-dehydrogenase